MLTTALVLYTVTVWPKNMTDSVAGLSVSQRVVTNASWWDRKSGYFAVKVMECDGAHRMVTLTKDRRILEDMGYDMARFGRKAKGDGEGAAVQDHAFDAVTKHGIRIGMSKSTVLAKLGRPFKTASRGEKGQYWCCLFKKVVMEDKETGDVLRNTYVFKNGKLIEIAINLDSVPGCGEDSLSDEGWPWTKF
ncbi:MAG: hypothetical protein JST30_13265 [Armatimonadetes bacterium]|nr:hypothetical protein [Armatimonadota bacterium]